jgi:hypothetical protein
MRLSLSPRISALTASTFVFLLAGSRPPAVRADMTYQVDIDATAIAPGTEGEIYFQFNPGGPFTQSATATVSNFDVDNITLSGGQTLGDAILTSPLPTGPLLLDNGSLTNYLLESVTFGAGSQLSFDVTLSGAAINAPDGNTNEYASTFFFGVLDTNFYPLLPIGNGADPLIMLEIAPGSGMVTGTDTSPVAVLAQGTVPEPSSMILLVLGASAVFAANKLSRPPVG